MMLPYAKHKSTALLGGSPTSCTLTSSGMIGYALSLISVQAPLRYRRETFCLNNAAPEEVSVQEVGDPPKTAVDLCFAYGNIMDSETLPTVLVVAAGYSTPTRAEVEVLAKVTVILLSNTMLVPYS